MEPGAVQHACGHCVGLSSGTIIAVITPTSDLSKRYPHIGPPTSVGLVEQLRLNASTTLNQLSRSTMRDKARSELSYRCDGLGWSHRIREGVTTR